VNPIVYVVDDNARMREADAENRQNLEQHADLNRRSESLTPREREIMALVGRM
jgi:FixJ family two-component response regulator